MFKPPEEIYWADVNNLMAAIANLLTADARTVFYDWIQQVRSSKDTKPAEVLTKVMDFIYVNLALQEEEKGSQRP